MRIRTCRECPRPRDEKGLALVAAVVVALVVVLLSTVAIQQSVNSLSQSAIANKQVNSTDAAEAGIQYEYNQIVTKATAQGTTFTCPAKTALVTPGAFGASYSLSIQIAGTWTPCTGQTVTLTSGTNYLIKSLGNTSATTTGSKTLEAQINVPTGLVGTKLPYTEAVYAGQDLTDTPKSFTVSPSAAVAATATTSAVPSVPADTYSGYIGQCGGGANSIIRTYGGDYSDLNDIAVPTLPASTSSAFSGNCSVAGNLIEINGTLTTASTSGVSLTGGSGVAGSIDTNGPVSITGNLTNVGTPASTGNIAASGPVSICPPSGGTVDIYGAVTSGDATNGVSFCPSGTTNVGADINSAGPIDGGSPSVAGVLNDYGSFGTYSNGLINLTNSYIQGSLYENASSSSSGITLSQSTVHGLLIAGGPITLTGASMLTTGGVQGQGSVTLNGGTYNNSIESEGMVTIEGGAVVNGTIYSQGGVNLVSGKVGAIEDEGSTVSCHSNATSGPLYYYSATLSACTAGASGPTSITSYPAAFSPTSAPSGRAPDDFPVANNGTMGIGGTALTANPQNDQNDVRNALVAAVTASANKINGKVTSSTCNNNATPCAVFPVLNYDQSSWLANTSFCGTAVTCTPSTMNLVTNNDCTADSGSVLAYVEGLEQAGALPTVLQTDCQFNTALAGISGLTLWSSLAVFDTAGFSLASNLTVSSGDGKAHQLLMIVPSTANTQWTAAGVATAASPPAGSVSCGLSGTTSGPDIVLNGALTDSSSLIQTFLYTPGSVCNQSGDTTTINGRVYAGQDVDAAGTWNQTLYDLSPWAATAGSTTQLGTPQIVSVSNVTS